ncbi:MAG TPA: TlpA disulfide reductase family protein [Pyrinomonadaceae bacterium]|nr:TlpA disulfide reductase family protein [Pyrinomonadaceae bacterium]
MKKLLLLLVLATVAATLVVAQSGRRISNPQPTYTAPVQPPANPEPPVRPSASRPAPAPLTFIPESLRERKIKGIDKGSNFRLSDFEGKVVVINLWASWCGPCRREVPEYEKVRKSYAGQQVEFVALTTEDPDESSDEVHKFLSQVSFGFRLGWADNEMARTLMNGRGSIPQTIVIDSEGRVIKHWTGYAPGRSGDRLRDAIDQALPQKSNP